MVVLVFAVFLVRVVTVCATFLRRLWAPCIFWVLMTKLLPHIFAFRLFGNFRIPISRRLIILAVQLIVELGHNLPVDVTDTGFNPVTAVLLAIFLVVISRVTWVTDTALTWMVFPVAAACFTRRLVTILWQ
jgi:hypothetical protein